MSYFQENFLRPNSIKLPFHIINYPTPFPMTVLIFKVNSLSPFFPGGNSNFLLSRLQGHLQHSLRTSRTFITDPPISYLSRIYIMIDCPRYDWAVFCLTYSFLSFSFFFYMIPSFVCYHFQLISLAIDFILFTVLQNDLHYSC